MGQGVWKCLASWSAVPAGGDTVTVTVLLMMTMMDPGVIGLMHLRFPGNMLFGCSHKIALLDSELEPSPKLGTCFLS